MAVSQVLTLTEVAGSPSVATNTSKVRILWTSTQSGGSYNDYTRTAKYWVSINGGSETEYTVSYTLPQGTTKTILDTTITVTHKDDGSGTVKVRTWMDTSISAGVVEKSQTVTLTTIARSSSIDSAANVTLGKACSVTWTPKSSNYSYKLKFALDNWSYTTPVISPKKTSAYTYTGYVLPMDVANQIPNTRTGTVTVTLYTYSNTSASQQVGSADSETFTITVPDNSTTKPEVSMSLTTVGTLPEAFANIDIQGLTKVKATLSAKGKYGADIDSYLMRVDGTYYDSSDEYTSGYFTEPGARFVYGYATDKRGHTGQTVATIDVIPYSNPRLENVSAVRCDENGNISESGTYLKIHAKRIYSPVVFNRQQKNFCKIQCRYSDGRSYSAWVTILNRDALDSDEVTTGPLLNGTLSAQASYTVQVRAIDDIGRYAETSITIPTDKVYWHRDGARNALGLGKYNERDDAIDSDWDFYMNGHKITGLPTPTGNSDAVPKSYVDPADIRMEKSLNEAGWYKIGTVSGEMCGVVTLTIGGIFVNNQASPSMVDMATQYNNARAILRIPSLADNQISKIGLIKESTTVYGVYAYYNTGNTNTVKVNIHTHMGSFTTVNWTMASVTESDMISVVTLKQ